MRFILSGAAVLAAAASASAATLRVPQQFETIQAAADAASDGDTIVVSRGAYFETVTVTGKNRLRFVGQSGAIWDGYVGEGVNGVCLEATGDGIAVQGFRFRLGSTQVRIQGSGATVTRCVFRSGTTTAVEIEGDNANVSGNVIRGFERTGIDISGNRALVLKNRISQNGDQGIDVSGDDARVERNIVTNIEDGYGIEISGANALASRNTVRITDEYALYVSGNGAVVDRNRCGVTGDDESIYVTGDDIRVTGNRVDSVPDDSYGIYVSSSSEAGGGLVERNLVTDTAESGIYVSANNLTVRSNKVYRCGSENEAGVYVSGDGNTLVGNLVLDSDGDGFEITGSGNELIACTVRGAGRDGFGVYGPDNTIRDCSASDCDGEGLDNGGTGTVVRDSTFRGNRIDVARNVEGGATFATFTGNSFDTGGEDTQSEVD